MRRLLALTIIIVVALGLGACAKKKDSLVTTTSTCSGDFGMKDGVCVNLGTGVTCYPTVEDCTVKTDDGDDDDACPEGKEQVGSKCLPKCDTDETRDAQGECVGPECEDGEKLENGRCVPSEEERRTPHIDLKAKDSVRQAITKNIDLELDDYDEEYSFQIEVEKPDIIKAEVTKIRGKYYIVVQGLEVGSSDIVVMAIGADGTELDKKKITVEVKENPLKFSSPEGAWKKEVPFDGITVESDPFAFGVNGGSGEYICEVASTDSSVAGNAKCVQILDGKFNVQLSALALGAATISVTIKDSGLDSMEPLSKKLEITVSSGAFVLEAYVINDRDEFGNGYSGGPVRTPWAVGSDEDRDDNPRAVPSHEVAIKAVGGRADYHSGYKCSMAENEKIKIADGEGSQADGQIPPNEDIACFVMLKDPSQISGELTVENVEITVENDYGFSREINFEKMIFYPLNWQFELKLTDADNYDRGKGFLTNKNIDLNINVHKIHYPIDFEILEGKGPYKIKITDSVPQSVLLKTELQFYGGNNCETLGKPIEIGDKEHDTVCNKFKLTATYYPLPARVFTRKITINVAGNDTDDPLSIQKTVTLNYRCDGAETNTGNFMKFFSIKYSYDGSTNDVCGDTKTGIGVAISAPISLFGGGPSYSKYVYEDRSGNEGSDPSTVEQETEGICIEDVTHIWWSMDARKCWDYPDVTLKAVNVVACEDAESYKKYNSNKCKRARWSGARGGSDLCSHEEGCTLWQDNITVVEPFKDTWTTVPSEYWNK